VVDKGDAIQEDHQQDHTSGQLEGEQDYEASEGCYLKKKD